MKTICLKKVSVKVGKIGYDIVAISDYIYQEPQETNIIKLDTFQEAYRYAEQYPTFHIHTGATFFRNKPQIRIYGSEYTWWLSEKSFEPIQIKTEYITDREPSIQTLARELSAVEFIEFLKDNHIEKVVDIK